VGQLENVMLWRRLLEWIAFTLFWLLLVFKTDPQNIVAAALAGMLTVAGISLGARRLQSTFAVPDGWVAAMATLPWKIVADTGRVFLALFRQIIRRDPAVGQLVIVPFDRQTEQPEDSARLALSLFGVSITPNTVAIAVTPDAILVHQLEQTSEPAERRDPKWPV
jgi:multisubunit Na+/H+ antiporter MnhE subunit